MEIKINKKTVEEFEKFWTDPYFKEYLSVNAPNYITSALMLQACEEFTKKLKGMLNMEN